MQISEYKRLGVADNLSTAIIIIACNRSGSGMIAVADC